jgi:hypothetical protein
VGGRNGASEAENPPQARLVVIDVQEVVGPRELSDSLATKHSSRSGTRRPTQDFSLRPDSSAPVRRDGWLRTGPGGRYATCAFRPVGRRSSLALTREGSGRRRCGRDGWFAANAATEDAAARWLPVAECSHDIGDRPRDSSWREAVVTQA